MFDRVYGTSDQTVFVPAQLLQALAVKPGAWGHSPVREAVAEPVRDWLDQARNPDRARLLNRLDRARLATSLDAAVTAATRLIAAGADPTGDGLGMLARRIHEGTEPVPAVVDLHVYDQFTSAPELNAPETNAPAAEPEAATTEEAAA